MKQSMLLSPRFCGAPCHRSWRNVEILSGLGRKRRSEGWKDGIPGTEKIPVPASFNDFYTDKDIREFAGDFWV